MYVNLLNQYEISQQAKEENQGKAMSNQILSSESNYQRFFASLNSTVWSNGIKYLRIYCENYSDRACVPSISDFCD